MQKSSLSTEEKKILEQFDQDQLSSVEDIEAEKQRYKTVASDTFKKSKSISIRISARDLQRIKSKAIQEGVPYQTLVTSLIHKYANVR